MRIMVSGGSGLIGSALVSLLEKSGNQVARLVRRNPANPSEVRWDPYGAIDPSAFEGFDAVVHLAGENVATRWTEAAKGRIQNSRVQGTQTIASSLARAVHRPAVLICASAVGYYGNRGEEILTETSPPGSGFLAEVCRQWEAAAQPAVAAGIRTVLLRIGFVLSGKGGGLARMLTPFRLGVGGRVGSGRQWISWIALADVVASIQHVLADIRLSGPVNVTAPNPVTNSDFTSELGRALHRPALFPMPEFAVKLAFGEMGEELLLTSQRALPARLITAGYQFRYPELGGALKTALSE
ncbi:MAG TPA: TIGR01777 family oxidoreductase [Terriglobales bacterium]|nr:TIGR01777 family oxidoreductase [Terriglobales bacterium]